MTPASDGRLRAAQLAAVCSVFSLAEQCLTSASVEEKVRVTREGKERADLGQLVFDGPGEAPWPISFVRFPDRPPTVDPRKLPRRKLATVEGRGALLHAVAHIEFTAIQLAWDLIYRFRGLPPDFYRDWLGVAAEEAHHFGMVRGRLGQLGFDYGTFPVHRGLWEVAEDTAEDLAARLALVPRGMEARGLDVTPGMIDKLEQIGDGESAAVLRRILHDEVGHVALGTHWFRWLCDRRGVPPESQYFALLQRYLRGSLRGPYNRELRKAAGFTESELARLETMV